MDINFKKELFCPMFWYAGQAIQDPSVRFVLAYGGSSASKTYSIVQVLLLESLIHGKSTVVLRKFSNTISRSIYKDFKLIAEQWGLDKYFDFLKMEIRCKKNKSIIDFTGLDDPEKIKGIVGFTYAVLEEFNEFDEEDWKQMNNRMRGLPNQTLIAIWNPVDILHWVKKVVVDKEDEAGIPTETWNNYTLADVDLSMYPENIHEYLKSNDIRIQTPQKNQKGNAVLLHTNYKDNWYISGHPNGVDGYVDQHQIDNFEQIRATDSNWYNIYALGHWGRVDRGDEFYKNFETTRHTASEEEIFNDQEFPLHITFDENVNPFLTLNIWQASGKVVRQIAEIALKHPRNTLGHTLKEFRYKFPPVRGNKRVYIYGDSTSRKADVKQEKGKDFYTIIEHTLQSYGYETSRRVPSKNPNVSTRGGFINRCFSKRGFNGIDIKICDKCVYSVQDYMYVKEADDGTKFKKMIKDPITEVRFQERGHTSDANDYFLLEYFKTDYQLYLDGGKPAPPIMIPRVTNFDW